MRNCRYVVIRQGPAAFNETRLCKGHISFTFATCALHIGLRTFNMWVAVWVLYSVTLLVFGLGLVYWVIWHYNKTASSKQVPYYSRCSTVNNTILSPNTVYTISSVLDILRTYRSLWRASYERGERMTSESEVLLLTSHWFAHLVMYAALLSFPLNFAH